MAVKNGARVQVGPLEDRVVVRRGTPSRPASDCSSARAQRRSRSRVRSSPSALAASTKARAFRWTSRPATRSCTEYSGTEVTIDGEQLAILRESDVLAVIG